MGTQNSLVEHLRSQGIRITTQRVAIAQAIDTLQGHFTAEEVYTAVQHVNPQVNPATVYRTLELLVGMGLATESHLGSDSEKLGAWELELETIAPELSLLQEAEEAAAEAPAAFAAGPADISGSRWVSG